MPVRFLRPFVAALLLYGATLPLPMHAIAGGAGSFIWPTTGRITQPYGCTGFWAEPRRGSCAHFHMGFDIANSRGTPIRATADGVIRIVGWDPWIHPDPDWMVMIDHGNGVASLYGHLRAKPIDGIERGAHVSQGQLIGYMDMTGKATGPHLHFGIYLNGEAVDPLDYVIGRFPPRPQGASGPPSGCVGEPADASGVGAWLGGRTAMVPPINVEPHCSA